MISETHVTADTSWDKVKVKGELADRAIFMDYGKFIFEGHPDDLFSETMEHPRIKSFLAKIL